VGIELRIGILSNGAGVENNDIGFVNVRGYFHAFTNELAGNALRVVFVELAAIGRDQELASHFNSLRS
jgi:hypothetical protein